MISKSKTSLYDFLIGLLIISSLAIYDVKIVFLGIQALLFAYTVLIVVGKRYVGTSEFRYILWGFVFISYSLISTMWCSDNNSSAMSCVFSTIQTFLIGLCILIYADRDERIIKCLNSMALAAVVLCMRFFVSVPISSWGNEQRIARDSFFGKNIPAIVLAYTAVFLLWRVIYQIQERKKKIVPIVLIVVFMFVSMMMGTKKSLLVFAIGFMVCLIAKSKNPLQIIGRMVLIGILLILFYIVIMRVDILYKSIGYRLNGFFNMFSGGDIDKSTIARSNYAVDALKVFSKHPILGIGMDGYRYVNPYSFAYSHSNFTEMLADLGILGFGMFYSIHLFILKKSVLIRNVSVLPFAIIIILVITDISTMTYSAEYFYIFCALILAVCDIKQREMISIEENSYGG